MLRVAIIFGLFPQRFLILHERAYLAETSTLHAKPLFEVQPLYLKSKASPAFARLAFVLDRTDYLEPLSSLMSGSISACFCSKVKAPGCSPA